MVRAPKSVDVKLNLRVLEISGTWEPNDAERRAAWELLNYGLRPLLADWHPTLEDWETRRPADRSRRDHEQAWDRAGALRTALRDTRGILTAYADLLAGACGVPNLLAAVPAAEPAP
ncbi:hypothetical protein [Streptomyces sp. NPDC003710]